ncbi:MAG TPA: hypothetical protein VFM70_09795 [Salinimicrobium sp.]|nr:hypothetical protein [Salinimicrobium sp.]
MKKSLLSLLVFMFAFTAYSQSISKNAIGLRLGDNDGFGTEISYQRGLSENNRLELDLGWRSSDHIDAFRLTGLYQWVWNIEGGFNWYLGAGAGIGSVSYDESHFGNDHDNDNFFGLVAGDVGIEYNFDFPLLLSLDFRPEIGFNDYNDDLGFDIGFGIRYQF